MVLWVGVRGCPWLHVTVRGCTWLCVLPVAVGGCEWLRHAVRGCARLVLILCAQIVNLLVRVGFFVRVHICFVRTHLFCAHSVCVL